MMIFDVESVFLTTIIQSPLGNRIYSISLSLEQIPFILFILDDSSNPTVRPLDLTLFIDFSKRCQLLRNSIGSITFYISVKNISATELDFDPADIMERFQRGDKARNTEGSGLGLAIAKSFTVPQNGHMHISFDADLFKVELIFQKELP